MDHSNEAAIRARAYQLWVESGHADGSQDQHWRQAEREIAEKARADEGVPDAGGAAPAPGRPQGGGAPHVDGMSRHPSVLDPRPNRSGE